MGEKVFMLESAKPSKRYTSVAYYRCPGIEIFIKIIEKKSDIVGIVIDGNNIGFIMEKNDDKT